MTQPHLVCSHCNHQSSWIPDDIFFLGKLENIEENIERFCKKMNCPYHYIKLHANKNPYSSSKKDITDETNTRVYELYKEDYLLLTNFMLILKMMYIIKK